MSVFADLTLIRDLVEATPEVPMARLRTMIARHVRHATERDVRRPRDPVDDNLQQLGEIFGLSPVEVAVLTFAMALQDGRALNDLVEACAPELRSTHTRTLATILQLSEPELAQVLAPAARLFSTGLLTRNDTNSLESTFHLRDGLIELVTTGEVTRDRLLAEFLADLTLREPCWLEHSHLRREIDLATTLLSRAHARHARGVHLLLHGPTGTGKSELARTIARSLDLPLYEAGAQARFDNRPSTADRVASLLMGQRLVTPGCGMLVFDELEDLFSHDQFGFLRGQPRTAMPKQVFNELLENNPVPIMWTANRVDHIDRAFLRRFSYVIEVREVGPRQRRAILAHHLGNDDMPGLTEVAGRYAASPAQLTSAIRSAALLANDAVPCPEAIGAVLDATCRLVDRKSMVRSAFDPSAYRLDVVNASTDLVALTDRLAAWRPGEDSGLSLCLYGPPGTGKSEYVHYLAHRMDRTVVSRRGSDLLGKYVGETEQHIAKAFDDARDEGSLLLIDEVDTFLADRRHAERSWEVSMANELLQQLESFPGVVAFTTNQWDRLDPAVMRRIVFKIEFRPLRPEQAAALFWTMFAPEASAVNGEVSDSLERELGKLEITPGDLHCVRRRRAMLADRSLETLVHEVAREVAARSGDSHPVGFLPRAMS